VNLRVGELLMLVEHREVIGIKTKAITRNRAGGRGGRW
jgi:hypothetical protein